APTLETIIRWGYVSLDKKRFVPTELGDIVHEMIHEYFLKITIVDFTVKMEEDLDQIEEGNVEWVKIIDDFYQDFRLRLEKAEKEMESIEIIDEPAVIVCEKRDYLKVIKMESLGKFMTISLFP